MGEGGGGGPNTLADWYAVGGGEAGDFVYDRGQEGTSTPASTRVSSPTTARAPASSAISADPESKSGLPAENLKYRFQWTAPIAASPHDPKIVYHGANVLFRTQRPRRDWQAISPDLTRNDRSKQQWSGGPITGDITGVENYGTIFSIAEAYAAAGQIWVGSDDGLVHLTRDDGASWSDVTPKRRRGRYDDRVHRALAPRRRHGLRRGPSLPDG